MTHGIAFTNLVVFLLFALMVAPELIRRLQHAYAHRSLSIETQLGFERKGAHVYLCNVACCTLAALAAYNFIFAIAWFANQ